jgi:hypothetical protein
MTRICMQCSAVMGEKCPQCGAESTADCIEGWHWCPEHGPFETGAGGLSHGVCEKCVAAWRATGNHTTSIQGGR